SHHIHFEQFLQLTPFTILVALLLLSYYYAINHGQISLTGTVVGTYPAFTVLLSFMFLHEAPSLFQKLAIIAIILGTVLVAFPNKVQKAKLNHWIWWAILALLTIGTSDFVIKVLLLKYDIYTYLFTYSFSSFLVTLALLLIDKKGRKIPKFNLKLYLPTLIGVTMLELGFFFLHLALRDGLVSLVSPISGIYVAITAVLAWIFLKEKINKIQAIGVVLAAIGVILVG
ncbi:MAG TPA: EamA family transporter, partial [Patescibacteria group bacterium]